MQIEWQEIEYSICLWIRIFGRNPQADANAILQNPHLSGVHFHCTCLCDELHYLRTMDGYQRCADSRIFSLHPVQHLVPAIMSPSPRILNLHLPKKLTMSSTRADCPTLVQTLNLRRSDRHTRPSHSTGLTEWQYKGGFPTCRNQRREICDRSKNKNKQCTHTKNGTHSILACVAFFVWVYCVQQVENGLKHWYRPIWPH